MDVESFQYLGSLIRSNDMHGKLCQRLLRPEQHSKGQLPLTSILFMYLRREQKCAIFTTYVCRY